MGWDRVIASVFEHRDIRMEILADRVVRSVPRIIKPLFRKVRITVNGYHVGQWIYAEGRKGNDRWNNAKIVSFDWDGKGCMLERPQQPGSFFFRSWKQICRRTSDWAPLYKTSSAA